MGGEVEPPGPGVSRGANRSSWLLLKALPRVFRQASSEWIDDNAPRLGASVAFYILLSLAPVIVIAVAVAAVVYGQEAAQGRLASEIRGVAGPDVARTIQEIIKSAYKPRTGVIATLLGLVTLIFGASSIFVELHDAMNTIWHVSLPPDRTNAAAIIRLIRNRFYSVAMVLGIGFLLLVSLLLNAWIAARSIAVPQAATFMILYLVIAVLFAALYKIVPDVTLKWSDVAPGAMITSLLFMIGKQFMGLYFAHTSFGSAYSAAGSPIVVLLWVYYSALLFFWGAEFSKVYKKTVESSGDRKH
ncbi:MAG: YihY/virulence factor BrkB family protein [Bryobacteraceae bacterium]|jgi:membrane protein